MFTLKMESVSKNTIFGLKMMVKSGLEKIFLKFLHAGDYFLLLHKSAQNHKFSSKSHYDIPISFILSNTYEKILSNVGKNFQVFHATINLMWTAFPWKPWKNNLTIFFSLSLPLSLPWFSLGDFDGGRYLHGKMDGIWRFLLFGLHQSLSRRLRGHLQLTGNKDQQQSGGMPEEGR